MLRERREKGRLAIWLDGSRRMYASHEVAVAIPLTANSERIGLPCA